LAFNQQSSFGKSRSKKGSEADGIDILKLNPVESKLVGLKLRATGNIKQERKRILPDPKLKKGNSYKTPLKGPNYFKKPTP
jgi:hypothetical protein